jgi:hypothetical protein
LTSAGAPENVNGMETAWELQIDATFASACDRLTEDQILVLMDDYKALLMVAAQHRDARAVRWLERRVDQITEAYGTRQIQPPLPF